jgi:dUTP pyrophosphatase
MGVTMKVIFKKINANAKSPAYMSAGAAGCDVSACIETPVVLQPGDRAAVGTGLQFEIPQGFEIQVRPRSGLAFKEGLTVINAPGTIDSDYRGEVKVLLVNLSQKPVTVSTGERIAQLVVSPVIQAEWQEETVLSETHRGEGGFGSTGK